MNDILFLSPADWFGPRGRFQHLAERFADCNRVAYFDGLGVRPIGLRDWRRVMSKLRHSATGRPAERKPLPANLAHISPLAIPMQGSALTSLVNQRLLRRALRGAQTAQAMGEPILWVSYPHPEIVNVLRHYPGRPVIYDCVDNWSEFKGAFHNLAQAEADLLQRADVVFSTAELLQDRLSRRHSRTFLVPNGVDVEGYQRALAGPLSLPADAAAIAGPRIGFIGNVAHWVNLELVLRILPRRPDWQFIFVGPWQRPEKPPQAPNFHWLGARDYEQIPHYIAAFDVCLIPFEDNELTRAVDPLKLYEYLAVGKPVVSTPLPRVLPFGHVIEIASQPQAFEDAIARALADGTPQRNAERQRSISAHSWTARVAHIDAILRAELGINLMDDRPPPSSLS